MLSKEISGQENERGNSCNGNFELAFNIIVYDFRPEKQNVRLEHTLKSWKLANFIKKPILKINLALKDTLKKSSLF